jgi:DNA polymerase-3 subunit delta'
VCHPAADAAALLRAAGGRPSDALRLARTGQSPKAWALLPKAVLRGDVGALADQAPAQAVGALQKLCHDLMAVGNGAAPRFFEPGDLPAAPSRLALARWSKSLAASARTAEHPFNAGLMLEALVSEARSTLNSAARRP